MSYVYLPKKADGTKLSTIIMGCERPKINDGAFVYWLLNV